MPHAPKRQTWAWWIATVGGLGAVPYASGTFGSLAGIAIAWMLHLLLQPFSGFLEMAGLATVLALLVVLGVSASSVLAAELAEHDPSVIVIDEVCGMLVVLLLLPFVWGAVVMGFLLFRFFDIVKPFPISWVERRLPAGWGVMGDDLVAGVAAGLCARGVMALLW